MTKKTTTKAAKRARANSRAVPDNGDTLAMNGDLLTAATVLENLADDLLKEAAEVQARIEWAVEDEETKDENGERCRDVYVNKSEAAKLRRLLREVSMQIEHLATRTRR